MAHHGELVEGHGKQMNGRTLAMVAIAFALASENAANATILTFANLTVNSPINQAYGDNVTSTTSGGFSYGVGAEGFTGDVTVTYALRTVLGSNAGATTPNVVSSANLPSLAEYVNAQVDAQNPVLEIRFTPTATASVTLLDFVVGRSATGTVGGRQYAIYDGSYSTLVGPTTYSNPGGVGSIVGISLNYAGAVGQELVFHIKLTDVLGLDNFRFAQVVPEPSGFALAGVVGIGAFFMRRQAKRRASLAAQRDQPPADSQSAPELV